MLSPSVTRTLLSHLGNDEMTDRRRFAAQRLASLTDREREVATTVGSGASNAEELSNWVRHAAGTVAGVFGGILLYFVYANLLSATEHTFALLLALLALVVAASVVVLATRKGKAIRFPVSAVRVFASRRSTGVRGGASPSSATPAAATMATDSIPRSWPWRKPSQRWIGPHPWRCFVTMRDARCFASAPR